jgi:hypothetical protein
VRPASELDVLRVLRTSHQHTSKEHHYRMNMLALKLFRDTVDPAVNYVKSKEFGIKDGKPILGTDHPLMKELMAQTSGRVLMELPFLHFTSDHLRFLQMGRHRFFSRISSASSLEKVPSWGSAAKRVRKCSTHFCPAFFTGSWTPPTLGFTASSPKTTQGFLYSSQSPKASVFILTRSCRPCPETP